MTETELRSYLDDWQRCNDALDLPADVRESLHELRRILIAGFCPVSEAAAHARVAAAIEIEKRFVYMCKECGLTTGNPVTHVCGDGS